MADYGPLGGVKIAGFISPGDTTDTYAVIDTQLGIDGLRNYSGTTTEVLSGTTVPLPRRRAGMIVGVEGGDRYFKLKDKNPWDFDLTDWEELDFSGGGSGSAISGGTYSAGTLTLINGSGGTITVTGFSSDNIYVTGGTVSTDGLLFLNWNNGGTANPIDLSDLIFTGNTSGDCITELWVKNISGCTGEDLHIGVQSGQDIYFDSTGSTTSPSLFINSKGQIGVGTNDPFSWATNDGTGIEVHNDSINDQIPLAFTELGTRRFYFETDFANTSNPVHIKGSSGTNLITFNTSSSSSRVGVGTTVPDGTFQVAKAGSIANQTKYPDETNIVINNTSNGFSGSTGPNSAAFRFDHGSGEDPGGLITSKRLPVWDSGEKSTTLEIWNASGETLYKRIEIQPDGHTTISGDTFIGGNLRILNIGSGTSITNLGVDINGNVVTGTTGVGGTGTTVTAYTYSNNNFTIKQSGGEPDLTANISVVTGLTVNGGFNVNGESIFSGDSTDVVKIFGSGDTSPLFSVEGSVGELLTVNDGLNDLLFAVNDISGLPTLQVFNDDTILMGNNLSPSLNTTTKINLGTGLSTVYSIPMSAYTGAWFEYTVKNTGGARAGQIMSIFSGNTVNFTETTTTDIGSTSDVSFSMSADSINSILQVSATTTGWEIKTIVRSI
jgi:hypothetical protein